MWLFFCYTIQLITIKLCTKFQIPNPSSCWEIFDGKKSLQTDKPTEKPTNIITEKAKTKYPLYTSYRGYKNFSRHHTPASCFGLGISWEPWSAGRWFKWNIKSYFPWKSYKIAYGHVETVSSTLGKKLSSLPVLHAQTFSYNWQQLFLNLSGRGRMTVEIISWSISMNVCDRAKI